jgi:uncharacterized protein YbjT (DUF2867 family)
MRVAITGATGFTGRRVVARLLAQGHEVSALIRPARDRAPGTVPSCRIVPGDMGDTAALRSLLTGMDAFVHVASLGFGHADAIVAAVDECDVRRCVFFSSTSLYTRLPSASKAERLHAEDRIRASKTAWTILRPTMIYGDAGDRNLSRLIRFVSRSPLIPLPGAGRALVQPVHVEDLGTAAVEALEAPATHCQAYELPGAEASPLRDVIDHLRRLLGRRSVVLPLPLSLMARLVRPWRALGLPPRITAEQVRRLGEDKAFSYERASAAWGYAPRGWRVGLAEEVKVLREQGWLD